MHPILFHLPFFGIPIYSYGVMLVIGFLLAVELAKFLARRFGMDPEVFVNAGLIALVAGVVGARLSHVIENYPQYTDASRSIWANFADAINIRSGGLTFYGGFILGFPACVAYGLYKRMPIRRGMDVLAPCLMVGLGLGRVGCFLNGCCYGAACNSTFVAAVTYPYYSNAFMDQYYRGDLKAKVPNDLTVPESVAGLPPQLIDPQLLKAEPQLLSVAQTLRSNPVLNAQLFSTFTALLIAAIGVAFLTMNPVSGRVMALTLMLEGTTRYLLEIIRSEPPVLHIAGYGWSLSMVLGVLIAAAGIVLWFALPNSRDSRALPSRVVAA